MEEQATQWTEKEGVSYKLPLAKDTCHLPLQVLSHVQLWLVDLQHTLNCVQEVEIRNKAVCSGKAGRTDLIR